MTILLRYALLVLAAAVAVVALRSTGAPGAPSLAAEATAARSVIPLSPGGLGALPPRRSRAASRRRVSLWRPRLLGASGEPAAVRGRSRRFGSGPERRFMVEVERGLGVDRARFATEVERALLDRRGWAGSGRVSFRRVDRGPVAFRVTLAGARTVDRLCAPLTTRGHYSCFMRGRAVVNLLRWAKGAAPYRKRRRAYRRYVVNHEVGHALGLGHAQCPGVGRQAPVMVQQTKGLGDCRPGWWPLPSERG